MFTRCSQILNEPAVLKWIWPKIAWVLTRNSKRVMLKVANQTWWGLQNQQDMLIE
jgi:hypothetical protein